MRTIRIVPTAFAVFLAVLPAVLPPPLPAAPARDDPFAWTQEYVGRKLVLRASDNANPFVYTLITRDFATLEMVGDMFPLLAPEVVTVTKSELDTRDGVLTLEIMAEPRGKGVLRFIAPPKSEDRISQVHVDRLIDLVLENAQDPPYVLNPESGTLHFKGSNHGHEYPGGLEFRNVAAAKAEGHALCKACFAPFNLLPDFEKERTMGLRIATEVRNSYPVSTDEALQVRVRELGERVLAKWPWPKRGFHYSFTVVEADGAGATACPGGWIYLYDDLVSLCETERELEGVIAHEIAHVEMRHGLRKLLQAEKAARTGAMAAGLVGLLALAADDQSSAVSGAALATSTAIMMADISVDIAISGYSPEAIMEADAFAVAYLTAVHGAQDRIHLGRILAKMEYLQECRTARDDVRALPASDPMSKVRSDFAMNAAVELFAEPLIVTLTSKGRTVLDLAINGITHHAFHERNIRAEVSDNTAREFGLHPPIRSAFHNQIHIFATATPTSYLWDGAQLKELEAKFDGRWLKFDNREDTWLVPGYTTSMVLVFDSGKDFHLESLKPEEIKEPKM